MPPTPVGTRSAILVGPGARSERLLPLLGEGARGLGDLLELLSAEATRALIDADQVPATDAGILQRWLERSGGELILFGSAGARRNWKELLSSPRARFLDWPLDVLDLESLRQEQRSHAPVPAPVSTSSSDPELAEIEAILHSPAGRAGGAAHEEADQHSDSSESFELDPEELAALAHEPMDPQALGADPLVMEPERAAAQAPHMPPSAPPAACDLVAPPPYFKDQVADLADIAQRIELSLELVAEADERAALAPLEDEVRRLVQFTRTLGYLVAPPGPGTQNVDLSELVEIFLSSAVSREHDAPRCLFRGGGPLPVRSDRALLTQALDAFYFVAQACAESGEIVRVQTLQSSMEGRPAGMIAIEFPAGRLNGITPETILTPYGLRRILPGLGPNALAAATGILAGQGGRALLERRGEGRLAWRLELPLSPIGGARN